MDDDTADVADEVAVALVSVRAYFAKTTSLPSVSAPQPSNKSNSYGLVVDGAGG